MIWGMGLWLALGCILDVWLALGCMLGHGVAVGVCCGRCWGIGITSCTGVPALKDRSCGWHWCACAGE